MSSTRITGGRTVLSRTPALWPLVIWVIVTTLCFSLLPDGVWGAVRWVLGAALLIEVAFLAGRRLRRRA